MSYGIMKSSQFTRESRGRSDTRLSSPLQASAKIGHCPTQLSAAHLPQPGRTIAQEHIRSPRKRAYVDRDSPEGRERSFYLHAVFLFTAKPLLLQISQGAGLLKRRGWDDLNQRRDRSLVIPGRVPL
jgi:hypothetical protein